VRAGPNPSRNCDRRGWRRRQPAARHALSIPLVTRAYSSGVFARTGKQLGDVKFDAKTRHARGAARCDEVVFDSANHQIYVAGGEGIIGVFEQTDADHYNRLADVPGAKSAKAAVLVPAMHRLYLAVRGIAASLRRARRSCAVAAQLSGRDFLTSIARRGQ